MCAVGSAWASEQGGAVWGLARISHRAPVGPGPWTYSFPADAGQGVSVYVLGTGIDTENAEFEGRAVFGKRFAGSSDKDCSGLGTHLAGTVGSKTYGVAKKASLVAVKVADCDGNSTVKDLLSGINWAVNDKRGVKGNVILIGMAGGKSTALNNAVQIAYSKGFVVVVPAGDQSQDACIVSPASAPNAVTVGATTEDDKLASGSNYGKCVDVLGPGKDIVSTWTGGTRTTGTRSGTGMAAAHAAGIAATFLSAGSLTSAQLTAKIVSTATKNAVTGLPSSTPNLLLYNGVS
ncbi:S8 family peptidase [Streptomyces sp. NPDC049949]|uniref:S8 family peptidase n=1 Tax=Streptomyces sp. NPDC049949 TaxID=3154627 RepID=UPI003448EE44